ncbi:MAG: acetoin utilization protein AcuC [Planctomycetes bacterium]|nr:acetoin utilization protein AcuC [Planctomycetota bacterium]
MPDCRIVDAPRLPTYDLGARHVFAPDRQLPLFDLLETAGLVTDAERLLPPPATDAELTTVHRSAYVELLKRLDDPSDRDALRRAPLYGMGTLDNPIRPGQHAAAAAAAGGSLALARAIQRGELRAGFNPAGGLHHAMPQAASGFCIYNDCALAIVAARQLGAERVVYIDFDVHHGDGVEFTFREDPSVLTISFHETPEVRWPNTGLVTDRGIGAGEGSAIDVPFASGTSDASWQRVVAAVLRPALARFRPDLIVTQHGADPHVTDPLADLSLTTASFEFAARLARELAEQHCGGRWLATGGGGYQPVTVLARAWSIVWCVLSGRPIPDALPAAWSARWRARAGTAAPPARFADDRYEDPRAARAAARNERMLDELRRVHGL